MKKFGIVNPLTNETDYFTGEELINETNIIIDEVYGYEVETVNEAIETLDDIGYEVVENISGAMERIISKYQGGF